MALNRVVKVHSHPRSGTHLILHTLAINFFPQNYMRSTGIAGHWDNKFTIVPIQTPKCLVGNHNVYYPDTGKRHRRIYIYRDGRAVIYSLWKTPGFKNKEQTKANISFSDYLRVPADWGGSMKQGAVLKGSWMYNWKYHVESWKDKPDSHLVGFEDLLENTERVLTKIADHFGLEQRTKKYKLPDELVGIRPNDGKIDTWRAHYTEEDLIFFHSEIPKDHWALWPCS